MIPADEIRLDRLARGHETARDVFVQATAREARRWTGHLDGGEAVAVSATDRNGRAVEVTIGVATRRELSVAFRTDSRTAETTEPVTVVDHDGRATPSATVYAEGAFASHLARAGVSVTHDLSEAVDLAFTRRMAGEFDRFAAGGGAVVHVPDTDGRMHGGGPFAYRALPEGESWVGVAGLFYHRSPLVSDLAPDRRLGWAFEGLYPATAATNVEPERDRVHVGYVEGWLENPASPLVVREYGDGTVAALTFRVPGVYSSHPVATLLCDLLVEELADD